MTLTRVIGYVDGFNLYFGIKSKAWKRFYWLDIPELLRQLLKPGQELVESKYFTSLVSSSPLNPDKPKRQTTYLEALGTLQNLSIFYGHYLQKEVRCRKCGSGWLNYSEKMTDVNIATELLTDAFHNRFDTAILVSGDSDLVGPVVAVRRLLAAKRVIVAFPPGRFSDALGKVASASFHIGRAKLAASQMADRVTKPDGFVLNRPASWV